VDNLTTPNIVCIAGNSFERSMLLLKVTEVANCQASQYRKLQIVFQLKLCGWEAAGLSQRWGAPFNEDGRNIYA
jgi:hypothetical protein